MRRLPALLLLAWTTCLKAVDPLVLGGGEFGPTSLSPHIEVLEDPSGELRLDDVLHPENAARWRPNGDAAPAFGFTKATVWLRFEVRSSTTMTTPVVVDLATARPSHLRWHVLEGDDLRASFDAGGADKLTTKGWLSRFPVLRLELAPGESRTVVLRASSDTSLWLPLTASGPEAYDRLDDDRVVRDLMQIGFCVALAFLALLLRLTHVQPMYGHMIYLGLAYALYLAGFNGYLARLWPETPHWVERQGMMLATSVGILVFTRFNGTYLRRETLTRAERVLQRFAELTMVVASLGFVALDYRSAAQALSPLLILCIAASLLVVTSRMRRRRDAGEAAFLVAWALYGVCMTWMSLLLFNVLPSRGGIALVQMLMLPTVLCGFFVAVAARQRSAEQAELRALRAEEAAGKARLAALRYQINPHFLFNTLTSVDALARTEPARVPGLVSRLATFLRLRLKPQDHGMVTLGEEIEAARAYLDIERERFGEDLRVELDVPAGLLGRPVPELILQPLVENAVKHGLRADGRIDLSVRARATATRLEVEVANTGRLDATAVRGQGGIGLENVRQRLALLHAGAASLSLAQEGERVVARLTLPLDS